MFNSLIPVLSVVADSLCFEADPPQQQSRAVRGTLSRQIKIEVLNETERTVSGTGVYPLKAKISEEILAQGDTSGIPKLGDRRVKVGVVVYPIDSDSNPGVPVLKYQTDAIDIEAATTDFAKMISKDFPMAPHSYYYQVFVSDPDHPFVKQPGGLLIEPDATFPFGRVLAVRYGQVNVLPKTKTKTKTKTKAKRD